MQITEVAREHSAAAGCEALFAVTAADVGLRAWIAVHDSKSGPGVGGIRRRAYETDDDAIEDACSLATQMTLKTRFAQLPCGGAKAVIVDHPDLHLDGAYRAIGQAVQQLEGRYLCGPDVGTGDSELVWVREATGYVNDVRNDASAATAQGVLAGVRASLAHGYDKAGKPAVVVQGVGRVGSIVATTLNGDTSLSFCDTNPAAVERLRTSLTGAEVISTDGAVERECVLLSPCAVGPVVTRANVDRLRCRIICGSANTQLEDDALADTLHTRRILYAPDFVVNAGAVIEGVLVLLSPGPDVRARVERGINGIEDRLTAVFQEADRAGCSPLRAALGMVL